MSFLELSHVMPPGRSPAGGDRITGTPAMVKLELLCEGKPAYFVGNEQRAESIEPNWRQALEYARELIERSADLAVLVRLAAACLRQRTLGDFADCMHTTAELLEYHWPDIHPDLEAFEEGDPPDASVRIGVLGRLEDEKLIIGPLRDVALTRDEGSRPISLSSLRAGGTSDVVDAAALLGDATHNLTRVIESARRIEQSVRVKSPLDADFSVGRFLTACEQLLAQVARSASENAGNTSVASSEAESQGSSVLMPVGADPVRGREQAMQALTQIIRYFESTEPSSPVIGLLERAKSLIGKDFWTLMNELGEQRLVDVVGESRLFPRRNQ